MIVLDTHAWLWLCLEPRRLSGGAATADPADRLIAATARAEGVALVSRDARIRASRVVDTVW